MSRTFKTKMRPCIVNAAVPEIAARRPDGNIYRNPKTMNNKKVGRNCLPLTGEYCLYLLIVHRTTFQVNAHIRTGKRKTTKAGTLSYSEQLSRDHVQVNSCK